MNVHLIGCSARALAAAVVASGWDATVWDQYADRDTAAFGPTFRVGNDRDRKAFQQEIAFADYVVPVGGLENEEDNWRWLETHSRFLAPAWERVAQWRDPLWLQRACGNLGIAFPETAPADSNRAGFTMECTRVALIKDPSRAGGLGVHWAERGERSGSSKCRERNSRDRTLYRQSFIPGPSVSCALLCPAGHPPECIGWSAALRPDAQFEAHPFLYHGSILLDDPPSRYRQAYESIAGLFCHSGRPHVVGLDWIDDGERLWLLEINPRWCASMELLEIRRPGCLVDGLLSKNHVDPGRSPLADCEVLVKRIIYAKQTLVIGEAFSDQLLAQREPQTAGSWVYQFADIPWPGQRVEEGAPICTVLAGSFV